jgi:hypothetical protein
VTKAIPGTRIYHFLLLLEEISKVTPRGDRVGFFHGVGVR